MELEIAQQPKVVQQQQIQALLANVEELTHQNEELWKTMESQNVERWRTIENQNEEESNSQANRRDKWIRVLFIPRVTFFFWEVYLGLHDNGLNNYLIWSYDHNIVLAFWESSTKCRKYRGVHG